MDKIVGIGEIAVSNDKKDMIKTFALSTCVAVAVYSPVNKAAGMVHVALPSPSRTGNDGAVPPGYYATTGVPFLINKMCTELGCMRGELKVELFGGARSVRNNDVFNIGQRNINTVKEILNQMNIRYTASETGGTYSRSLQMNVATGKIEMTTQPLVI